MSAKVRLVILLSFTFVIGLAISLASHGQATHAAPTLTIKVNTTTDSNNSDSFISLREALLLVNGGTGGNGLRTGLGRALSAGELGQIVGGVITTTGVAANIVFTDLPGLSTITLAGGTGNANESLPPILTSGVVIDGRIARDRAQPARRLRQHPS